MKRNILQSLKKSLIQMKLIREGKLPKKTWDEFKEELKQEDIDIQKAINTLENIKNIDLKEKYKDYIK